MDFNQRFQNRLHCICDESVFFEIIEDIECDWGNHFVIQCPKCEELFSVDCECPAFGNIFNLSKNNDLPYSEKEKIDYFKNSHPK
ncbi:hypothetical protein [Nitrosopumilus sp.]|uniref:hypothetical protein n=1 Tax=Nitrosopumilus sp. TaxID=2024843 RepID=UPI00247CBC21|nr:hypothetical protein [Nitrosopumilus sp.]MCV0430140.1 hypothetical protein [Nitrosopumilus sp.]